MSISTRAQRSLAQIRDYRDFPSWWTILQVGIAGVVALILIYRFFAPEDPANAEYSQYIAQQEAAQAEAAVEAPTEEPGEGAAPVGGTEQLQLQDGTGAVDVPAEALAVGTAAAKAVFTTDFTDVTLAPGTELPDLPQEFENPRVSEPVVAVYTETLVTFAFAVDPDNSDGPEGPRQINITVAEDNGTWGYTGG